MHVACCPPRLENLATGLELLGIATSYKHFYPRKYLLVASLVGLASCFLGYTLTQV